MVLAFFFSYFLFCFFINRSCVLGTFLYIFITLTRSLYLEKNLKINFINFQIKLPLIQVLSICQIEVQNMVCTKLHTMNGSWTDQQDKDLKGCMHTRNELTETSREKRTHLYSHVKALFSKIFNAWGIPLVILQQEPITNKNPNYNYRKQDYW